MSENLRKYIFNAGDYVFCKRRVYPPWPAKIVSYSPAKNKYQVFFYGYANKAYINARYIYNYANYKKRYATARMMKCKQFSEAIKQIESAVAGDPIYLPESGKCLAMDENGAAYNVPELEMETANGEIDTTLENKENILNSNAQEKSMKTKPWKHPTSDIKVNVLLVFLPHQVYGIDLDFQKPKIFNTKEDELEWKQKSLTEAFELKVKLETGRCDIDTISDRIYFYPKEFNIPNNERKRFVTDLQNLQKSLETEREFVWSVIKLHSAMRSTEPNGNYCLKVLSYCKKLQLNKLMLLRNPDSVKIIHNIAEHSLKKKGMELEYTTFSKNLAKPTLLDLYRTIKGYFTQTDNENFLEVFYKEIDEFKMYTADLSKDIVNMLNESSYESLVKAHNSISGRLGNFIS